MKTKSNLLKVVLIMLVILAVSIISFGGIFIQDKNNMINLLPDYILSKDFTGYREVRLVVKNDETVKTQDETETTNEEITVSSTDNKNDYIKSKEILQKRLATMGLIEYNIRQNLEDGSVIIELPEDYYTDQIVAQLTYQGKFEIVDSQTNEVLLDNNDLAEAIAGYGQDASGYTSLYLAFRFNDEGTEKLKNVTNTYKHVEKEETTQEAESETEAESSEETEKEIKLNIDDQTLITTHFESEISSGILQLNLGSSQTLDASEMQERLNEAGKLSLVINTGKLPFEYDMKDNIYIESDISSVTLSITVYVTLAFVVLGMLYLMIRYSKLGLKAAFLFVGYISLMLIAIRFFNVEISISGLIGIILSIVLDYVLLVSILNTNKAGTEIYGAILKNIGKYSIIYMPSLIIAIVFTLYNISFGAVLFWGMFINILYNLSVTKALLVDKK